MMDEKIVGEVVSGSNRNEHLKNHNHTSILTRMKNSFWSFLVVYMIYSLTHGVQGSYTFPILTTLERKFNLPSVAAGSLVSVSTVGFLISSFVVSFFVPPRLRVRAFACSMLLTGLCSVFYILPHFLFPTIKTDIHRRNFTTANPSVSKNSGMCMFENVNMSNAYDNHQSLSENNHEPNWVAMILFYLSEILHGAAGAPVWTIGISMIDDHTPVSLASKLMGFMMFMRFMSPVLSFGMGSFFLTYPEDLKETSLTTTDPEWIGAWWVGFVICFVINISISIPSFFLAGVFEKVGYNQESKKRQLDKPRLFNSFNKKYLNDKKSFRTEEDCEESFTKDESCSRVIDQRGGHKVESRKKDMKDNLASTRVREQDISEMNLEEVNLSKKKYNNEEEVDDDKEELPLEKRTFKELYITVKRLMKNATYMVISVGVCFDVLILAFYGFLPKFVEVYFKQTAWKASLLGGMVPAFAGGIMSYLGGVISGRLKASEDHRVNSNVQLCLSMSIVNTIAFFSLIFIPCLDNYLPYGHQETNKSVSINSTCNMDCACNVGLFDPVCGSANQWYVSPCQAGCRDVQYFDHHEVYSNCSCVQEAPFTASSGYCPEDCPYMLPLYVSCLVAVVFFLNIYNVPVTNATLKCVSDRDKPVALALQTIFICFAIFPSPMLFGAFIDSTCILWQTSSENQSTGSCLAYDHHLLRIAFHGCIVVSRAVVVVLYSIAYFLTRRNLKQLQNPVNKIGITTEEK